jgi:23S rRNA pseudouridine2605 synthase
VGLARALSKLGVCSRSQAAAWIAEGRVRLAGSVTRNPEAPVRIGVDPVEVDGQAAAPSEKIYWMLNKPRGAVTTAADERGRSTVYDFLPQDSRGAGTRWIAPVGRLDQASEGLLLLTNDSEWGARVTAPETHLDKIYHVQIAANAGEGLLASLERGVENRGEVLHVKSAAALRGGEKNAWVTIVLDEGKNRHIRRMFESLGIEVLRLLRVAIGPLALGGLAKGATRPLTAAEKASLDRAMAGTQMH